MKIEKLNNFKIFPKELVEYKEMGNVREIRRMTKVNNKATVKKISDTEYVKLSTGEVLEYNFSDKEKNRLDNIKSVRRSLSDLRDVLNANVIDVSFCRWVTLTYAENMTDTKRLYDDFRLFVMRFRYYLKKRDYNKCEYIVAMEPQARGAWHCHIVFIFDKKAPYIPNDELRELWGQGFVTVKRLDDVDNVGAYLTAYLGDMELQDAIDNNLCDLSSEIKSVDVDIDGKKVTKKYLKGCRLKMYPTGFHLWRSSRGIKKPVVTKMTNEQAEKKVSSGKLTYENTIYLSNDDCTFETIISKRYYNMKRK